MFLDKILILVKLKYNIIKVKHNKFLSFKLICINDFSKKKTVEFMC
jgi:hypothetical protein